MAAPAKHRGGGSRGARRCSKEESRGGSGGAEGKRPEERGSRGGEEGRERKPQRGGAEKNPPLLHAPRTRAADGLIDVRMERETE